MPQSHLMATAKVRFTNLENSRPRIITRQRKFQYEDDAQLWLNQFTRSDHLRIHNQRIITNIQEIEIKLKQARERARQNYSRPLR